MQVVVAVMRKLLHAIWGMPKHKKDFDSNKSLGSQKKPLDREEVSKISKVEKS